MGKLQNVLVVKCCECEYAIHVQHDPFTGKERYHCENGIMQIDSWGNQYLMADNGCEVGRKKT